MRAKSTFLLLTLIIGMVATSGLASAEPWKKQPNPWQKWEEPAPYASTTIVNVTNKIKLPAAKRVGIN
ncbi:MAG TPA: hypothetical protein ENJ56_07745, partial [Anaerolineae bacterium]|nr:hypothetical protein [Anaerolineae bacterium]